STTPGGRWGRQRSAPGCWPSSPPCSTARRPDHVATWGILQPCPPRRDPSPMSEATAAAPQHNALGRMLDVVERVGNKVPHPAIIFLILIAVVIILSQVLYIAGVSVTYDVAEPPAVPALEGYPSGSSVEI